MQFLCSTEGIVSLDYLGIGVKTLVGGGFSDIFLNITNYAFISDELEDNDEPQDLSAYYKPGELEKTLQPMLKAFKKNNLTVKAGYVKWIGDFTENFFKLCEESLRVTGRLGGKYLVIQSLESGIDNRDFYLKLAPVAKECGVIILLENQCREINAHLIRGFCSDEVEAAQWIDSLNEAVGEERFGFSLDVGTCNLCAQSPRDFVVTLGNRLKMLILRDNDGHHETALLPFT